MADLIVDDFAGGGGASLGIEMALGRSPDIAVNHDPEAIAMHAVNHPHTTHLCESVWDVDPVGWCAPTRDGDRRQARRRVNYLVEQGRIPRAEDLPCIDCADETPGGGRHEYDHAKGYDGENQLYVEPVCHRNREEARRG